MSERVVDNGGRQRFELDLGGKLAFLDYQRAGSRLYLNHAEVPVELRGHGAGARLVAGALDLVRERGEQIVPVCPFVHAFVQRHPGYAELVAR